ncbi:MAG: PAS domain S-box protein [Nitrospirae bacterium YQR-1]
MVNEKILPKISWIPICIFICISVIICVTGYLTYSKQKEHLIKHITDDLSAIGTLKTNQIIKWKKERYRDALAIKESAIFASYVSQYLKNRNSELHNATLKSRLLSIRNVNMYLRVILTGKDGSVVLSTETGKLLDKFSKSLIDKAISTKDIVFSDLYMNLDNAVRLTVAVPVLLKDFTNHDLPPEVTGTILLDIDPNEELFPLIQTWPTPSDSAETLLIRREGNDVVYLNELRHKKGTALVFRLPIDEKTMLPAAMAVLGQKGLVEGFDYRGHRVIASIMPVPDTPWFIVSKVDTDEIYQPIREFSILLGFIVILLIALTLTGISALWYRRNANIIAKLYESNELFRRVFEDGPIGISLSETNYKFVNANKKFCDILEYSLDELKNMTFLDFTHPRYIARDTELVKQLYRQEIPSFTVEKQYITKPGNVIWANLTLSVIKGSDGKVLYGLAMIQDITGAKKMQQELVRTNRLYAALSQVNQCIVRTKNKTVLLKMICQICVKYGMFKAVWIGIIDKDTLSLNPVASAGVEKECLSELAGVSVSEIVLRDGKYLINNDLRIKPAQTYNANNANYRSYAVFPIIMKEKVIGVLTIYSSEKNFFMEPEITLIEEIVLDLSYALETIENEQSKRIIELAFRESEKKYRQIVELAQEGIWVIDKDSVTTFVNQKMADMLGYTVDEMTGTELFRFMDIRGIEITKRNIQRRKEGITEQHDFEFTRKDGKRIYTILSASPIMDENGKYEGAIALVNDITERKHKDRLLFLRDRMAKMGEMLSLIAHQWKQPIAALGAAVNRFELDSMLDSLSKKTVSEFLSKIKFQIAHLSQTINDFSNFFKPEVGKQKSDMNSIIGKTLRIIGSQFQAGGIDIEVNYQSDIELETHANELVHVFLSILVNSKDAIDGRRVDNPKVTINVYQEDGYAVTEISDNGGGIPSEILDQIFFPYFSTKEELNGTGLGLYMARMIVEEHCNGTISAGNRKHGAVFTIKIPVNIL